MDTGSQKLRRAAEKRLKKAEKREQRKPRYADSTAPNVSLPRRYADGSCTPNLARFPNGPHCFGHDLVPLPLLRNKEMI